MDKEDILCAAIWFKDYKTHIHQPKNIASGYVVCGRRHHNCFITKHILNPDIAIADHVQGFVTTSNRFVDRKEAYEIAFAASQCIESDTKILFSEDLY